MLSDSDAKLTIQKHWKHSAIITGSLHFGYGQKLMETELLPGELSAEIFQVGCYTVRSTKRVYQVCESVVYSPEKEHPASPKDVSLVKKEMPPETAGLRYQAAFIFRHGVTGSVYLI